MATNQSDRFAETNPLYREFPRYDRIEFAKFVEDFGVDPDRIDELLQEYWSFQRQSDEDMGEGNVGTFVEVKWGKKGEEPKFLMGSYPLN